MNILVLCTGNSARSILLEAVLNDLGGGRLHAYSAGGQPAGKVNPHSLTLLERKGHATTGYRSKSWDEFGAVDAPVMDVAITGSSSATDETGPIWPGAPIRTHWGVEDTAVQAFEAAYGILRRRTEVFLASDIEAMDQAMLGAHLVACGKVM